MRSRRSFRHQPGAFDASGLCHRDPFFGRKDQLTAVLAVIARDEEIDKNKSRIIQFVRDRSAKIPRAI